jgi:hypothetical protein
LQGALLRTAQGVLLCFEHARSICLKGLPEIIATDAIPNGMAFRNPVSMLDIPNDFTIGLPKRQGVARGGTSRIDQTQDEHIFVRQDLPQRHVADLPATDFSDRSRFSSHSRASGRATLHR